VPSIVAPFAGDQPFWADRLTDRHRTAVDSAEGVDGAAAARASRWPATRECLPGRAARRRDV
jgi:hypothetical protein